MAQTRIILQAQMPPPTLGPLSNKTDMDTIMPPICKIIENTMKNY
jgi:hypothetical protein